MNVLKVFISSTYEDLKDYRQAAIKVANNYKWMPLAMEFFLSQPIAWRNFCCRMQF